MMPGVCISHPWNREYQNLIPDACCGRLNYVQTLRLPESRTLVIVRQDPRR